MLELAVKSQVEVVLAGQPPDLAELGTRLLDRISPPNWTLEWSLPGWLGGALGLDASSIAALTLANVYGLAHIKLQDDLIDGEMAGDDQRTALLLSTVLHRKWLLSYVTFFPGDSPFWGYFERYMRRWAGAEMHSPPARAFRDYDEADLRGLGERGAPLKVCAAAACLLTQREELLPRLESALDHLLIGAVLLDHALDWTGDLAAGRYNAFVAYASLLPQTSDHAEANRRAVAEELVIGKMAQPYFQLLRRELAAASAIARQAGCEDLARFIAWLRRETFSYSKGMVEMARDRLHRALEQLFVVAETHVGV